MEKIITRQCAWELLKEYTKTPALRSHALAVEAVMRYFAGIYGGDEELWGAVGLLHDLDYEMFPQEHCIKSARIMEGLGIDSVYIRAVMSHAYGICTDVRPESQMEKVLDTVDELTGLINAACLMRPSKSVLDIEVKSVKKKFRDKSFAAGVNRDTILNGCHMLNMDLDEIIRLTICGMREAAEDIGLKGSL